MNALKNPSLLSNNIFAVGLVGSWWELFYSSETTTNNIQIKLSKPCICHFAVKIVCCKVSIDTAYFVISWPFMQHRWRHHWRNGESTLHYCIVYLFLIYSTNRNIHKHSSYSMLYKILKKHFCYPHIYFFENIRTSFVQTKINENDTCNSIQKPDYRINGTIHSI